jgi:AbrB family looped-hinge helix DNA binding protein
MGVDQNIVLRHFGSTGTHMETVTVSSKFRIVIPRRVRETLGIRPGQRVQVLLYDGRMEFIPLRSIKQMRGFVKGLDTTVERDRDRV